MADRATPMDYFDRNKAWVAPGEHDYRTDLGDQESAFQSWVTQNKVPFDPAAEVTDYDMRGFWQALQAGDPKATSAINPNDDRIHYPDYWKTPYHETFSAESQWADPSKAPAWNDKDQLATPDGQIVFDDKKQRLLGIMRMFAENIQKLKMIRQTDPSAAQGAQ